MKTGEKIVINYGSSSKTVNSRAEAAREVKRLLKEHVLVTVENVSLKIEEGFKSLKQ